MKRRNWEGWEDKGNPAEERAEREHWKRSDEAREAERAEDLHVARQSLEDRRIAARVQELRNADICPKCNGSGVNKAATLALHLTSGHVRCTLCNGHGDLRPR